ncbi:2-keto-4-pentenoate hydratase [Mycolicibacterium novocastrense]|uniref:2-keto-4-pentenoate hydratase n=1 Tax=Mycolicibacterium novocastrense TaxID=59813 RepID=UPI0009EA85FA|nr:fumarylacetoacetate hydrolase family protein [Mycolicibacterium novocastrense]
MIQPDRVETATSLDVDTLAASLDHAARVTTATPQLSLSHHLTLTDAYAVQASGVRIRERRGDSVVGVKLGLTSKAKAEQMGVSDVIIGVLHESMALAPDEPTDVSQWLHPRVEPEVAFRLGRDIEPTETETDALMAVQDIAPALEIIDSRYENFQFSLTDVVADNTSAAGFVVGDWLAYEEIVANHDLGDLEVRLEVNGEIQQSGNSADILGSPLNALRAALRMARTHNRELRSGSIILAGAATAAITLSAGCTITAIVSGLGSVQFSTQPPRPTGDAYISTDTSAVQGRER